LLSKSVGFDTPNFGKREISIAFIGFEEALEILLGVLLLTATLSWSHTK